MRLLLFEPAPYGGLLHYVAQLGDALADRGHQVELLVARDNEIVGRTKYARMRAELPQLVQGHAPPPSGLAYRRRQGQVAIQLARCWSRFALEARAARYDAVITGADTSVALSAFAASLLTIVPGRSPLVRIAHNVRAHNRWGGEELFRESRLLAALHHWAYPRFDLTLFPSDEARLEYEAHAPRSHAAIMPHGDERLFGDQPPPASKEERILFFGEWRKIKGLQVLMDAFDELVRRRPQARLTIAGSPFPADLDPEPIRAWGASHGDAVEIIDRYVPVDAVAELFGRARVVVTPYLAGAQSGVVALAMTMARAVVTSDVGTLGRVVIDGATGRVVAPGDARALAVALEEVLADPALAAAYGAEGRRRGVERLGWEHAAQCLEAALQPLVVRDGG
jgi:glycosyltransferase involved in cell wall biosynthesis